MSFREMPYNDMMAQVSRKLIKVSEEEEKERIDEIKNCNHLFVKLREFDTSYYDYSNSAIVECVHCGVTNKFRDLERTMQSYRRSLDLYVLTKLHYTDVDYNEMTIESVMMNRIKRENKELTMMSDKIIRTFHPGVLYKIAKMFNPEASNEELFDIMVELNNLETVEEKNKLNNPTDASDLIERYKKEVKVLKK